MSLVTHAFNHYVPYDKWKEYPSGDWGTDKEFVYVSSRDDRISIKQSHSYGDIEETWNINIGIRVGEEYLWYSNYYHTGSALGAKVKATKKLNEFRRLLNGEV